jgi:hypothetical protein
LKYDRNSIGFDTRRTLMIVSHITARTQFIDVDGDRFASRRWGAGIGTPAVLIQLTPLSATDHSFSNPTALRHLTDFVDEGEPS